MATSLVGLGSNLGDRAATVDAAVVQLSQHADISVSARSCNFESDPVGGPTNQGRFINSAVVVETTLPPHGLLVALQAIETKLGRQREIRWDARTIDLDLLLYDNLVVDSANLTIPHPRMSFRRFVLEPAREIAADWVHPLCRRTLGELLTNIRSPTNYVAIAGPPCAGKSWLARQVVNGLNQLGRVQARLVAERFDSERMAAFYSDPSGHAWDVELKFLRERSQLLDGELWPDTGEWRISDFWFDQSLAYADVWLDSRRAVAFRVKWKQAMRSVMAPKLLVVLDAATEQLVAEIARRNRACERSVGTETVQRIQTAMNELIRSSDHGPLLMLKDPGDFQQQRCVDEVVAAVLAMQ